MSVYIKKQEFENLLAKRNLAQDDFAKILGVTREYISMLKDPAKYDNSPSPELREKMLKVLVVTFDDIFFIQNFRFSGNGQKDTTDVLEAQEIPATGQPDAKNDHLKEG